MKCMRCGADTPRYTVDQRYCKACELAVARIVELDAKRRTRFAFAKAIAA